MLALKIGILLTFQNGVNGRFAAGKYKCNLLVVFSLFPTDGTFNQTQILDQIFALNVKCYLFIYIFFQCTWF